MQPITDAEITKVESVLLPTGKVFDTDCRRFIKELTTCDLHAVPGSGKTTALLAKLMSFEQQLPLRDGKAILVISHTNTAVDEIKQKLGSVCPKLFAYPNFIGTIQSFVDQFLAIPYYCQKYGHKPIRIDNEIYNEKVSTFRTKRSFGAYTWVNRKRDPQGFLEGLRFNIGMQLCKDRKGILFTEAGPHTNTYKALLEMKHELLKDGFLCFDDAYLLASLYIKDYPHIIALLRERFAFIFVDEMQDMEKQQHDLLETLYFGGQNPPVYQRIGDRNQSIFTEGSEDDTIWSPRTNTLTLAGSNRLSPNIARIVRPFGLHDDIDIVGRGSSSLKPHILLYEDDKPHLVLPYFADLVQQYKATGKIINSSGPVKAIGWVGKPVAPNKIHIPNYHASYNRASQQQRIDYNSLRGYLQSLAPDRASFRDVRNCILSAILKALRVQGIRTVQHREYTKTQFLNELKLNSSQLYETFNSHLLHYCTLILFSKDVNDCQQAIASYLPQFLADWKGVSTVLPQLTSFLTSAINAGSTQAPAETDSNRFDHNGVNIEVTTVLAVKGETHAATLYMETFYYTLETEKCLNQLLGISATRIGNQARKKEAAKMMYVGFSRATCFLSFAAAKSRLIAHKAALENVGWKVLEI